MIDNGKKKNYWTFEDIARNTMQRKYWMNIKDVDNSLVEQFLPAPFIIDNFVKGDEISYETYLVEMVNSSQYFLDKLKNGSYHHRKEQSHRECDCCGDGYELDFKIAESESMMQAKSIFSLGKRCIASGVIATTTPKVNRQSRRYKPIIAPYLHKLLRDYSEHQLKEINDSSNKEPERDIETKEIRVFLNNLQVQKHLLLFIPYRFYFDNREIDLTIKEGANHIIRLLENDYNTSMSFRRKCCNLDTFFAFYFKKTFVIVKSNKGGLEIVDYVDKLKMPTFCHLEIYAPLGWDLTE